MTVIKICTGRTCSDHGSAYLFDRFEAEKTAAQEALSTEPCPCLGHCDQAVNVKVEQPQKTQIYHQQDGPKLAQLMKKLS